MKSASRTFFLVVSGILVLAGCATFGFSDGDRLLDAAAFGDIRAGAGIALVCIASTLLYNQRFDAAAVAGVCCIGVGALLITLKSRVVL